MKKLLYFSAVFMMATLAVATAQETTTSSLGLTRYSDRSSLELRQLRAQIDAVVQETPLAGQSALAPYLNALSSAEQALAEFKTAPEIELSRRQSDLEKAKDKVFGMWNDYRGSREAGSPSRLASPELPPVTSTPAY